MKPESVCVCMCLCFSTLEMYAHTNTHCCFADFFLSLFSGSVLASPRAMSANAIRLKEELLFTWIIIRILCASSQRNGPSGFDPSSFTQSLLFSVCPSHVPQTSTMWQNDAFYRQQSSSPTSAHYNLWIRCCVWFSVLQCWIYLCSCWGKLYKPQ